MKYLIFVVSVGTLSGILYGFSIPYSPTAAIQVAIAAGLSTVAASVLVWGVTTFSKPW